MPVFDPAIRIIAHQLGAPSGPLGRVVARVLNRGNGPTISAAVEALDLAGSESVADFGFGGGRGLDLLLAATSGVVHGCEPSTDMLQRTKRLHADAIASGRLRLHEAVLEELPLPDGSLDAWISLNTIYFVHDLPAAARELRRVTAKGGRGVLGVADPAWLARQPFARHGFIIRPIADVATVLETAGFTVEVRETTGVVSAPDQAYDLLICTTG